MGKSGRRLERKNTKKVTVKQIMDESVKAGVIEAAAIACEVIYNNYGKLRNKEQRLSVFVNLFSEALLTIEEPTELRQEIRREFNRVVK